MLKTVLCDIMAKVYFVNDDKEVEVPDGSNLRILEGKLSVLFACGEGICGSCMVTVKEGLENLEPPNEQEKATLENFGAKPNQRLLCQAVIKSGRIVIEQ